MLGQTLRDLRKANNLTLKELASIVDVTPGYISQIERDLIDPSLSILRKIASALNTSLSALFSEGDTSSCIIRKDKRKRISFSDCGTIYEFLTPVANRDIITPKMEVTWIVIKPHSWSASMPSLHQSDECFVLLKGEMEVHLEDEQYLMNALDSIYITASTVHKFYNATDENIIGISIVI